MLFNAPCILHRRLATFFAVAFARPARVAPSIVFANTPRSLPSATRSAVSVARPPVRTALRLGLIRASSRIQRPRHRFYTSTVLPTSCDHIARVRARATIFSTME